MIPRWKLEREAERIYSQVMRIPWYFYGKFSKSRHDRSKHRSLHIDEGQKPLSDNLAILLLYQPKGVLKSTLSQIDFLASKGFSTLVVSNAPISASDLEQLTARTFRVIQRPNFGYDFGGYRDGVLHCLENDIRPKNLIIMNDSTWFPLTDDCDLIEVAQDHSADIFGISYFMHSKKPELSHLQSYFFRFNGKTVADPFFEEYWRDMPVSSNRYTVIRKCEMGLTNSFVKRGFSVGYQYDNKVVLNHLLAMSVSDLREVTRYLMKIMPRNAAIIAKVDAAENWHQEAKMAFTKNDGLTTFLTLPPQVLISGLKSPVLKKNKSGLYKMQRDELCRLGLLDLISSDIGQEIKGWEAR